MRGFILRGIGLGKRFKQLICHYLWRITIWAKSWAPNIYAQGEEEKKDKPAIHDSKLVVTWLVQNLWLGADRGLKKAHLHHWASKNHADVPEG